MWRPGWLKKIAAWPAGEHPIHLGDDKSSFSQGFLKAAACAIAQPGRDIGNGAHRGGIANRGPAGATPGAAVCKLARAAALDGPWVLAWACGAIGASTTPTAACCLAWPRCWAWARPGGRPGSSATRKVMRRVAPRARKCSTTLVENHRPLPGGLRPTCITSNVAMRRCICRAASTASAATHAGQELAVTAPTPVWATPATP